MVFAQMCAEVSKFPLLNKQTKNSFDFYHRRIGFEHIFVEETLDKFIGNKTNGFLFIVFPGFLPFNARVPTNTSPSGFPSQALCGHLHGKVPHS